MLSSYPRDGSRSNFNYLDGIVDEFLYYASDLEVFDLTETQFALLDEIDTFMTDFAVSHNIDGHWTALRDTIASTKY